MKGSYFNNIKDIILDNWWSARDGDYRYCRREFDDEAQAKEDEMLRDFLEKSDDKELSKEEKKEIEKELKELEKRAKEDEKAFERINDSYLSEFGLGKDAEYIMDLRKQIALLQCDFVIENRQYLRNKIRHLERELKEMMERPINMDKDEILIHLEKWMGFRLDEKKVTAFKFYKIVKAYEKEATKKT